MPFVGYEAERILEVLSLKLTAGIHLLLTHATSTNITHHIAASCSSSVPMATSLILNCDFVKPEWLRELIRLCNESSNPSAPSFTLPSTPKYSPSFDTSLEPAHKNSKTWLRNEDRSHLFKDLRFICVLHKDKPLDTDLRSLIEIGKGQVESFNIRDGKAKFRKVLSRGSAKTGKQLVVLSLVPKHDLEDFEEELSS